MSAFDITFAVLTVLLGLALLALFVLVTYHFMGHQGPQLREGLVLVRRFIGWAWSLFRRFVVWAATNLLSALGRLVRFLVRNASRWWGKRKKRIKLLGMSLFGTGALIGGTILFARLYPNPSLSELKLYLYVLIAAAAVIWLNRWLMEKEKK